MAEPLYHVPMPARHGDDVHLVRMTEAEARQLGIRTYEYVMVACQVCGRDYEYLIDRRRRAGFYCSDRCRWARQAARRKAVRAEALAPGIVCGWCGTRFRPARPHALTCLARCRQALSRAARRGDLVPRYMSTGEAVE